MVWPKNKKKENGDPHSLMFQDSGDSEIIIPDEGSSENTSPAPGDEDIIVL